MAIIIQKLNGARYLRFDGLRFNMSPAKRADGTYCIDPGRPVAVRLYAYTDTKARNEAKAPLWSAEQVFTMNDLGLLEEIPGSQVLVGGVAHCLPESIGPEDIYAAVYAALKAVPGISVVEDDFVKRTPPPTVPTNPS